MSFLERVGRLVAGSGSTATSDAATLLTQCYVECVQRARQLHRHAEMAPQAYSGDGLRGLAAAEEAQAHRLREALQAAGVNAPAVSTVPPLPGALSHWARIVQDLQAHRLSTRRLRELAIQFADTLPTVANLFDDLCLEENNHCERLRTLIARADPQALD